MTSLFYIGLKLKAGISIMQVLQKKVEFKSE